VNAEQLVAHCDRISDAPDAIGRLRRFVLDLAVRGKLADQCPDDRAALELIGRANLELPRLAKERGIKRDRRFPPIDAGEAPFAVPRGWEWVRLRQVTTHRGQTTPVGEFTYIDVTSINKESGCIKAANIVSAHAAPSRARKLVEAGDVLYSCVRPYLLNIAIVDRNFVPRPIASTAFAVLDGAGLVHPKYLWIALRSPVMVRCVEDKMRGLAYPAINDSEFSLLPLPLPPLAEQHRIVAKVDELMALCDRLETAQAERERRRDRLVAASLARLSQPSADAPAFREHARFHLDHLPRLVTRIEHVQSLRRTILDLAVRGRLVEQDSREEPASFLLDRIRAAKVRLVSERKIPKEHRLPPIEPDERPFEIPESWVWTQAYEISMRISDGVHRKPNYVSAGVPFLTVKNLTEGSGISFRDTKFISRADHEEFIKRTHPERGDVLITKDGTIGVGRLVETSREFSIFVSVALVKMVERQISPFFALCINSQSVRAIIVSKGAALKHLHLVDLRALPFPLPPLAEQSRIVAKVDQLMALCDQLEARLGAAQTERRRLLAAVLHEAVAPAA
jgi:type I restriction enzyme S subunit